ncbi:MAG: hypothetical protein K2H87_01040 [Duncaniella sp.]|nr:hypothetical protein [Duncaniella sp.]
MHLYYSADYLLRSYLFAAETVVSSGDVHAPSAEPLVLHKAMDNVYLFVPASLHKHQQVSDLSCPFQRGNGYTMPPAPY